MTGKRLFVPFLLTIILGFAISAVLARLPDYNLVNSTSGAATRNAVAHQAALEQEEWARLDDAAWQRIQPDLLAWGKKGKPYICAYYKWRICRRRISPRSPAPRAEECIVLAGAAAECLSSAA